MIAHRLSTLDVCDARLVVAHGRLAEATGNIDLYTSSVHAVGGPNGYGKTE
jgi:ABC-type multidrug transport system fused ATPase/permease subunit